MGLVGADVLRVVLGADAKKMTADEILAVIHRIRLPEWESNLRRWIAVTATGENGRVPSDDEIRSWLADETVMIKVTCLVRRIPESWLKEE
jgi:hypothetical protein